MLTSFRDIFSESLLFFHGIGLHVYINTLNSTIFHFKLQVSKTDRRLKCYFLSMSNFNTDDSKCRYLGAAYLISISDDFKVSKKRSDLDLAETILRDLGSQFIVSGNICDQLYQFLNKG